jgi:hypothetical protein
VSIAAPLPNAGDAQITWRADGARGPALGLSGILVDTCIRENVMTAGAGIQNVKVSMPQLKDVALGAAVDAPEVLVAGLPAALLSGLRIEDNDFQCTMFGIDLGPPITKSGDEPADEAPRCVTHMGATRIAINSFAGCAVAAIRLGGIVAPNLPDPTKGVNFTHGLQTDEARLTSHIDVLSNTLSIQGRGIVFGTDDTRVMGNDIRHTLVNREMMAKADSTAAIMLLRGLMDGIARCVVAENRVLRFAGCGIEIRSNIQSAAIRANTVQGAMEIGIGMRRDVNVSGLTSTGSLSIERNIIMDIAAPSLPAYAISVVAAERLRIVGNVIERINDSPNTSGNAVRIRSNEAAEIVLHCNTITALGPADDARGIDIEGQFNSLQVSENSVRPRDSKGGSRFRALVIGRSSGNHDPALLAGADGSMSIQGNLFHNGSSEELTVAIGTDTACVFNGNRCFGNVPIVSILAGSISACSNVCSRPQRSKVTTSTAMLLHAKPLMVTAIGNVVIGPIGVPNGPPVTGTNVNVP